MTPTADPPPRPVLPQGGEVWCHWLHLDLPEEEWERLGEFLSPEELARAGRFQFPGGRRRFVAARGQLRAALGRCLGIPPAAVAITTEDRGKPVLAPESAPSELHFNLSHSGDAALLAITRAGPVGADLEQVRPLAEMDGLVTRFFSAGEQSAFARLAAAEKPPAFFRLWTRKEAWLKATGVGITRGLDQVEVTFQPDAPARLLGLPVGAGDPRDWTLNEPCAPEGFLAAVAVRHPYAQLLSAPDRR